MDEIIFYELKPLKSRLKLLYGIIIFVFSIISFIFILYYWDIYVYFSMDVEFLVSMITSILLIVLSAYIIGLIKSDMDHIFGKIIKLHILRIVTGCKDVKVYRWKDLDSNQQHSISKELIEYLEKAYESIIERKVIEFLIKVFEYLQNIDTAENPFVKDQEYWQRMPKYTEVIELFKDSFRVLIITLNTNENENIVFLVLINQQNKNKIIEPICILQNMEISLFSKDEEIINAIQGYKQIVWNLNRLGF
ncbi:MAG: hypothetical protein ABDH21_04430 [bacterium]